MDNNNKINAGPEGKRIAFGACAAFKDEWQAHLGAAKKLRGRNVLTPVQTVRLQTNPIDRSFEGAYVRVCLTHGSQVDDSLRCPAGHKVKRWGVQRCTQS